MTTTPITETIATKATADLAWLKTHIVLLAVVISLAVGSVYAIEDLIAKHDQATEARYSQILTQQTAQATALADQLKTDETSWTQLSSQLNAQNQVQQQQIAARDKQISLLISKISTLQPPEIVADLQPKLHAGNATVLPDGVKLDTDAARDVDKQITQGVAAVADLANTKTELANETTLAMTANKNLSDASAAVAALQKQNTDQIQACAAQVKTIKAQARKSKIKWFFAGVITGIIGGHYL